MSRKEPIKATVININKYGEVFDPKTYFVKRSENPELYRFLENHKITGGTHYGK